MSRKCWASPFTPCIAGGTRATAPSATGWAAMCGTAERPLRLGWNSMSTNVGNCGARISLGAVQEGTWTEPKGSHLAPLRLLVALLRSIFAAAVQEPRLAREWQLSPDGEPTGSIRAPLG